MPHTSKSRHLFWNLKESVLVLTLSPRRKVTYHSLLIGFSHHKLISIQDFGHVRFKFSSMAAINLSSCTNKLSPNNNKDAELKKHFPLGNDLNKILPD